MRKLTVYIALLLMSTVMVVQKAAAQYGPNIVAKGILDGGLGQLEVDSLRTVEDSAFFNPANIGILDTAYRVQNVITLRINEATPLYLRTAFMATVHLKLIYSNGSTIDSIPYSLTVNYDSITTYNARASFVFYGGRRVTVRIDSIDTHSATWPVTSVLLLENQLTCSPEFIFACTSTVGNITVIPSEDPDADELPVTWTTVTGADQYDLEWTYIDSSAINNGTYGDSLNPDPDLIFFHNATRITTSGTSYNIPLIYDNKGALFIRVRAVQRKSSNAVLPGMWSSEADPSIVGSFSHTGHQSNLNWQSSISFAEEGKRKVIVQYYDGSLRSRQTVTKDNTTNKTSIAETYYDYQGRPVIQVMPAPSLNNIIQYTASFNLSINGAEYTQSNYDTLPDPGMYCDLKADSMSVLAGASQYFSPNNPNKMAGMNQFIPDAKGYPFVETEYTQDNTGRISRKSSLGPDHRLGSGHETKYYYGTPDQDEIDALFGTEVGDKSHYLKNMTRDPNGQYSVAYLDMHGRTIATALAGASPSSLQPLASNNPVMVTESLADSGSVFFQDLSIIHQKSIVVAAPGNYEFNYSLIPESLTEMACDSSDICYTCLYDLQITISDNCNNQTFYNKKAFDTVIHNFSFGAIAASCPPGSAPFNVTFTLPLQEGSYQVTKKLTVNKDAYFYYRDSIYLPNNTCSTLEEFIDEQKQIIAGLNTECIATCSACRDSVGTYVEFRDRFIRETGLSPADTTVYKNEILSAYNNAVASCDVLCNDNMGDDVGIRAAMLQDLTPPYGQYADTTGARNGDKYSIFFLPPNENDALIPVYQRDQIVYKDFNGNTDSVYNLEAELMVKPNTLSPAQFVQNFRSSWAESLLPYHPEYCKLKEMEKHRASYIWMRKMESIDNFREARDAGYLNPTGNGSYPYPVVTANKDPFASNAGLKNELEDKMEEFLKRGPWFNPEPTLSIWGMASMMTKCQTGLSSCVDFYATESNAFDTTEMCEGDLDMAWKYFRQLYIQEKQNILNREINKTGSCIPLSPYYTEVPSYDRLFTDGHQPQFSNVLNTTIERNGLQHLLQANRNSDKANKAVSMSQTELDSFHVQNVRSMSAQWALQLSDCYTNQQLQDSILPRLRALCLMACDADHPFGASTLPAGETYTPAGTSYAFKSFQDILNAFNAANGITNVLDCNAEKITAPQPYDNQPIYANKPVFTKPGECECTLINDQYNTFLLSNEGDVSFSAYLKRTQNVSIRDVDLNLLRDMCNNTNTSGPGTDECVFLPYPIYLPASMQCNTGTVCAPCTLVDSLYDSYLTTYPGQIPDVADSDDTTQVKKNTLFRNYMNNRLGFSIQAYEYLRFMQECEDSTVTDTLECVDRPVGNLFLFDGTGRLMDIQATVDDGYILAGVTAGNGAGGDDGVIIKTNGTGMVQWTKAFGGTGNDHFTRVRHTTDNGYIAVGTTRSGRYAQGEMMIVKLNSSGVTEWTRNIGFNSIYGETGYDIVQTSDGGYTALGIYDQHTGNGEFMIARLDDDGTVDWVRRFGTSRLQPDTCTPFTDSLSFNGSPAYGLVERGDTIVVAGTGYDANLGNRYFGVIYHVDKATGELISNWHYADMSNVNKSTWFRDIYTTSNGYRILANTANKYTADSLQVAVITLSFAGDIADYKRFNLPAGSNKISSSGMYPTTDGGYLVAQTGISNAHIYWQRVDAEGILQSETESAIPGNQLIGRLIQNENNSFTAVGTNNGNKPLLVDLFPTAPTGCYDNTVSIGMTSPTLQRINWALEGSEYMLPVYTDTTLIATVLSTTDSSLVCPGNGNCYTVYNGPRLCGKVDPLLPPISIDSTTICSDSTFFAVSMGTEINKVYRDSLIGNFEKKYNEVCLNAYRYESFTVTHLKQEYHYTLYYYDQAGNLVKTVPPAGVQANHDPEFLEDVKAARVADEVLVPAHTLVTSYRYNTFNDVVAQHSPDGGVSHYWYDRIGRLVIAQNANQEDSSKYSYSKFDDHGRMDEMGQVKSLTGMTDNISRNQADLSTWISNAHSTAEQIIKTTYDQEYLPLQPVMAAKNLLDRVAWTAVYNSAADLENDSAESAIYYSYDIQGNIDTLVQDYKWGVMAENGNRFKKVVYDYDLLSRNVHKVAFQPGQQDAIYHLYQYDADNRITSLQTSTDSINWDDDVYYSYYQHHKLARMILGQQQVQGVNFAYSTNGWIKNINPNVHTAPGYTLIPDGSSGSVVAKPAYDITYSFFRNDYKPISGVVPSEFNLGDTLDNEFRPLYNGNVSSMGVNLSALNSPLLYNYKYDQLDRLVEMDAWRKTANNWSDIESIPDFAERISYDPSGNILKYKRNGNNTFASLPLQMDSLTYYYANGSNKLDHIRDSVSSSAYTIDIDNQSPGNYQYDANGNMIADGAEQISKIEWTVRGKISRITKNDGTVIAYTYDADGDRISKTVNTEDSTITTWYVRDGEGNVLSVYTAGKPSINSGNLTQTELHIYGSNRIGLLNRNINVQTLPVITDSTMPLLGTGQEFLFARGHKMYELTNHLSNVLVTVSDKKFGVSIDDSTVDHFIAEIRTAQDYFPFGMLQPGREYGSNYRYGFNGKESDNEVKGTGNHLDFGERIYDPRVGRFLSVDPLYKTFAMLTPYQYASNTPIMAIDLDGLESVTTINRQLPTRSGQTPQDRINVIEEIKIRQDEVMSLVPQLKIPGYNIGYIEKHPLHVQHQLDEVVKQTVETFLKFEYTWYPTRQSFGGTTIYTVQHSMFIDFDYELLNAEQDANFAKNLTQKVRAAATIVQKAISTHGSITGAGSETTPQRFGTTLDYWGKLADVMDGEFESVVYGIIKDIVTDKAEDYVKTALTARLGKEVAKQIMKRGTMLLGFLFSSDGEGLGASTQARVNIIKEELRKKTIAAMLLYFAAGNNINKITIDLKALEKQLRVEEKKQVDNYQIGVPKRFEE